MISNSPLMKQGTYVIFSKSDVILCCNAFF